MRKIYALLIVFSALTILVSNANARPPHFGISDYNISELAIVSQVTTIPVGRIYNNDNVTLNFTCSWEGSSQLPLIINPSTVLIEPDQNRQVILTVDRPAPSCIGNYSGYVRIYPQAIENENVSGSPVVAGGSMTVKLQIAYAPGNQSEAPQSETPSESEEPKGEGQLNPLVLLVAIVICSFIPVSYLKANRKSQLRLEKSHFLLF